jgi:hypothetical protein
VSVRLSVRLSTGWFTGLRIFDPSLKLSEPDIFIKLVMFDNACFNLPIVKEGQILVLQDIHVSQRTHHGPVESARRNF